MKKLLLLLIFPMMINAQIDKTIRAKVAMMQNFVKKDSLGEQTFWQTKGKITFGIVNYTPEQNPIFKDLFIKQYQELLPVYKRMIVSEDEKDTSLFVKILIRQEDDYRALLTKPQLELYSKKFIELEKNNLESYISFNSIFFSDKLLNEYKLKFSYKP